MTGTGQDGGRKFILSASTMRLRRLKGLLEAVSALAGRPVRSHVQLREACRELALARPRPEGPVAIAAVREGRRTVGHRLADDESVLRVAHGVADGRTMEVRLSGALAKRVAGRAGLKDARRRPWHKDPVKAASYEALADRLVEAWTPIVLEGGEQDGWRLALVAPRICQEGRAADVIAIVGDEMCQAALLYLTPDQFWFGDEGRRRVRFAVSAALAAAQGSPRGATSFWRGSDTGANAWSLAAAAGIRLPDMYDPGTRSNEIEFGLVRRMKFCLDKTSSAAMGRFRRLLPDAVGDHAAICGGGKFADPRAAAEFFEARREWTLQDYGRVNQAIRLIPLLRSYVDKPRVMDPIRAGRPIREAVAAILRHDADDDVAAIPRLHDKTIRSLACRWGIRFDGYHAWRNHARLIMTLEALYRRDPHLRPLGQREVKAVFGILMMLDGDVERMADAVSAHRDVAGKVREVRDLHDVARWVEDRLQLVWRGRPAGCSEPRLFELAYRVLFPAGRRHAGLSEVVRDWHQRRGRMDTALNDLFKSMLAAHLEQVVDVADVLFPHFMAGETEIDGVRMRPLVDERDIAREGDEMNHCVGGYAGRAVRGTSILISQISQEGRSTVEVMLIEGEDGPALEVVQNRSAANADPPERHRRAIDRLLARVPEETKRKLAANIAVATALADQNDARAYQILTDAERLRLRRHALDDLVRYMPRAMRRATVEEWVAAFVVADGAERLQAAE